MGFTLTEPFKRDFDELCVSTLTFWSSVLRIKWLNTTACVYLCLRGRACSSIHADTKGCSLWHSFSWVRVCVANHFNSLSQAAHQPIHTDRCIVHASISHKGQLCPLCFKGLHFCFLMQDTIHASVSALCDCAWVWWWAFIDLCEFVRGCVNVFVCLCSAI